VGRYTGPVEKLSRREGVQLYLKGERVAAGKSAIERRPYPPGQHGRHRQRQSEYRLQLREKQKAKRYYGIRERQFRRYFDRARRQEGIVGENLLRQLERRLDNVVYRLGLASTRAQARQFVGHGHLQVDGRKVDRPGYQLSPGEVVTLSADSPIEPIARQATELVHGVPSWLLADHENLSGRFERVPDRTDIPVPIDEQLIVELYSK
jgi:small subunit ribosomal protein S4